MKLSFKKKLFSVYMRTLNEDNVRFEQQFLASSYSSLLILQKWNNGREFELVDLKYWISSIFHLPLTISTEIC